MNYLSEVLSSAEELEIEPILAKYPEIAADVDVCKDKIITYLEDVYVKHRERPKKNRLLVNKTKQIQEEINNFLVKMGQVTKRDLTGSENMVHGYVKSLERATVAVTLVSALCEVHEALTKIKELQESHSYLSCMKIIKEAKNSINCISVDEQLPALQELRLLVNTEESSLLNNLSNIFKDFIIVKPTENRNVIKIRNESDTMEEVLLALYFYRTSVTALDNITRFLWDHVFVPVVDFTTEIKIEVQDNFAVMEIITVDPNKKSSYCEVFSNIKTILSFLLTNFNISMGDGLSTLSYIGRDIRDNLSELIIKHCLQDTISSTAEGLEEYQVVIVATEDLEEALVTSKIFTEDTSSILEYANNIDILFINKKCNDYIMLAQAHMKKDLHDLVEVGEEREVMGLSIGFPRCSVSRSVPDLVDLLVKIMQQAISSSEICAGRLFCTVINICRKYAIFVPEHHKKLLQTIPQQIAIFYNNCMYISHKLAEWNGTYLRQLPTVLSIERNSFNNERSDLQEIASEMFTTYIDRQIKQIDEIMTHAGMQRQTLDQLDGSTEKCLRQCLRQQELLKTVWHKVLPYSVYNKTLGTILGSLCDYVVDAVVKFEDISCDAAEQLVELFKMVQIRVSKVFTDPNEVTLFVGSWYKLSELVFVLSASLLDINDRWADGKGPLALQFKSEELKHLVMALFQNTEMRAALLAKIHD